MFCFQCEQTRRSKGCATEVGACGKDAVVSDLQDLLIHQLEGLGQYRKRLAALGRSDAAADSFIAFGLFTTLTNVNFDRNRFLALIGEAAATRDRLRAAFEQAAGEAGGEPETPHGAAQFAPAATLAGLLAQADASACAKASSGSART